MPEILCMSCKGGCPVSVRGQYCQAFVFCWTFDRVLPECEFYIEERFRGLEGVRP